MAALLLGTRLALAVPYATSLTNDNGVVWFRLNESADHVAVVANGGATTNDLGALPAGLHQFTLGFSGAFEVTVAKNSPLGFITPVAPNLGALLQFSPNTESTRFFSPRGVAINNNPASPWFGRIYVANATGGAVTNLAFGPTRTVGDGLYVLNPDFTDGTGQGDTPLTAGLNFSQSGDLAPYRLAVGEDDQLYVADFGNVTGSLYRTDPDVSPGSGANVLGGPMGAVFPVGTTRIHGSIAAAIVTGTLATSNLQAYVIDEDLQTGVTDTAHYMHNSLWRHDLGDSLVAPPVFPALIVDAPWFDLAGQTMDLDRGTNGWFYATDYRATGTDRGGLYVHDETGQQLWDSLSATRIVLTNDQAIDLLRGTGGGAVSRNGDVLAVINLDTSVLTVMPLANGVPDLANRLVLDGFGPASGPGRDVAFDAAGNLYAISSGAQALRVFSPGGQTLAITGSDGTFVLQRPPTVAVVATTSTISESGPNPGIFSISRLGDTNSDLVVAYALGGSAINGMDYATNTLSATIPAGATNVEVVITPLDDSISEPVESVTLDLIGSAQYDLLAQQTATINIVDDDQAVITIAAVDSNACERLPGDRLSFRIDRAGETNSELFIICDTRPGTAIRDIDWNGQNPDPLALFVESLAAGEVSRTFFLEPIDDAILEGDESVVIRILPFLDYRPGVPDTAVAWIIDDELPPAAVLFADDFDNDTSAGWTVLFGANNGIYDAEVRWAFDYGTLDIPPAPNSFFVSTLGVFLQVNKTNSTPGGAAGINLYPAGRSFAGNFALRFDLFLNYTPEVTATTEHALAGLNHSGQLTNRVTQSTDTNNTTRGGDGIFVAIVNDGSGNRDWTAYTAMGADQVPVQITNRTAGAMAGILSAPPYASAGSPGVAPGAAKVWSEVELGQIDNIITLKVNNRVVYSFTNASPFVGGSVMIGYNDQFDSVGSAGNFAIVDNVRVVNLDLVITRVELLPDNGVSIEFASPRGGSAAEFRLQRTDNLALPDWTDESGAVVSPITQGFRFDVPAGGGSRFYRVVR